LLIDNASNDNTLVEAGKLVSDKLSHKRNEDRWSCSKSWNYGVRDAWERGYDYCMIINNDVLLHPDCIDEMVDRFERGNVSGDITKEIIDSNKPIVMVTAMDVRGDCTNPKDVLSKKLDEYRKVPEAEHPNFSCFMINKKFTETVGEFDEGFRPAYFEDNDAHYRIRMAGLKAIVHPYALFYHYGSRTTNEASPDGKPTVSSIQFEHNRELYVEKWGGRPGEEKFKIPFNNDIYTIKCVEQLFKL
jgi:GT2 family glycosyltransferase